MTKRLEGKVAIITGAARGMGKAFSLAMAREGANIVATDINDVTETISAAKDLGVNALAVKANVAIEEDTQRMAEEVISEFGKIDILVNNAGIFPMKAIDDMTFVDWKQVTSVNLDGVFLCTKAVVPHMKKQQYGRIINMSSSSFMAGVPNFSHYVATKGAVIGMARSLASELGKDGITVNCVAPGLTATEGGKELPQELWDAVLSAQSIPRNENQEDVVGAIVFLASDEASFITGQTLCVDGGLSKH